MLLPEEEETNSMVNMIIMASIINMEEGVIIGTETEIGTEIGIEIGTEIEIGIEIGTEIEIVIGTEIEGGDAEMEVVAVKVVEGVAEDVEDLVARAEVVILMRVRISICSDFNSYCYIPKCFFNFFNKSAIYYSHYNYGSQREREFLVLVFFEFLVSRQEMEDEKQEIVVNR